MNTIDPRKYVRIAAALYQEGIATDDVSKMAEAAVEYRQVLRLLGIDPDTGGPDDSNRL